MDKHMERENVYIHYLIQDLENFMERNIKKVEDLIKKPAVMSMEEGWFVLDSYSKGLKKVMDIIRVSKDIDDKQMFKLVSILSSEILAWIALTYPHIEHTLQPLVKDMNIRNKHILDVIFDALILLEDFIDNPSDMADKKEEIYSIYGDISRFFGFLSQVAHKGALEN
ncbi:MAG: hypothetical protein GXO45_01060 [Aquificae bacterium]|nr:hypothetical protein [Aquificota bacterium]